MTTIILTIIGVLIAAAAALMVIYYGGDVFERYSNEAEAGRLVTEGAQIEAAVELHYRQTGVYPTDSDPIQQLLDTDYLSHRPVGREGISPDNQWAIDYEEGQIRSVIGTTSDEDAMDVCVTARRQVNFPDPENVLQCDNPALNGLDPCCIRTP